MTDEHQLGIEFGRKDDHRAQIGVQWESLIAKFLSRSKDVKQTRTKDDGNTLELGL